MTLCIYKSHLQEQGHLRYRGLTLEPGLGLGLAGEHLVASSLLTGPGWIQPEMARWVHLPVGSPPAGRSMRGRCKMVGWQLGPGAQTSNYKDMLPRLVGVGVGDPENVQEVER